MFFSDEDEEGQSGEYYKSLPFLEEKGECSGCKQHRILVNNMGHNLCTLCNRDLNEHCKTCFRTYDRVLSEEQSLSCVNCID